MEEEEETDFLIADNLTPAEIKIRNKEIIRLLACAMVAYINCENVTIERQVQASEAVNRKRLAKGKKPLEPFYITRIRGVRYEANEGEQVGRHVGFRFDVRGHFRRLDDGRTVWVKPHQRGVHHELYKPKVYEVE